MSAVPPDPRAVPSPRRRHAFVSVFSIVLGLIGLVIAGLGVYLMTLGGSWYYGLAGIAMVASAVLLWSPVLGMLRTISEIFGATGGAALIFTAAAFFSALMLGMPRPSQLPRRYLLLGGALFIGTEASLSLSIGLAHHRGQALELVMINYLWPCLTVLLTVLTRMQRGNWLLLPATVLCLLGVVLVITGEGAWSPAMLLANLRSNPLAYALALAASCMWATYSVVTKRIGGSRNAVPLFMIATAVVLWLKYALGDAPPLHLHWGGLAQVAVFGLLTATAYSCWNHGLQHGNVTSMAIFSYFAPVLSVLWSSVWLSLQPSMGFVQGVACVTAGSLLCWWATRARPLPPPAPPAAHTA